MARSLSAYRLRTGISSRYRNAGLADHKINRADRSLPAACRTSVAQLREVFFDSLLRTAPGLIVRDGRHGT
jgi:hypothetical protein